MTDQLRLFSSPSVPSAAKIKKPRKTPVMLKDGAWGLKRLRELEWSEEMGWTLLRLDLERLGVDVDRLGGGDDR